MWEKPRAPPPDRTMPTERPARRRASRVDAGVQVALAQRVRLDRVERVDPPASAPGADGDVPADQVAAAQLGRGRRTAGSARAAGRDRHDAVGLLEAELASRRRPPPRCPATSSTWSLARLGAVEQRPVGGRRARRRAGRRDLAAVQHRRRARASPSRRLSADRDRAHRHAARRAATSAIVDGRGRAPDGAGARLRAAARPACGSARATAPARVSQQPLEVVAGRCGSGRCRARRAPRPRAATRSAAPSSPSAAPRPSSRDTDAVAASAPAARPARTTYSASPGSPAWNSSSPAPQPHASRGRPAIASRMRRGQVGEQRHAGRGSPRSTRRRARSGARGRARPAHAAPARARRAATRALRARSAPGASARASDGVRDTSSLAADAADQQAAERRQRAARPRRTSTRCRRRRAASSGDGMPMIATTIATPSAAPTWRATEFRPVAVPKLSPGADATAAPLRFGNVAPGADAEDHHARQPLGDERGLEPHLRDEPEQPGAPDQRADDQHDAVAEAHGQLAGRARRRRPPRTGPGVIARPASSAEYCHTAVRKRTLTSV